MAYSSGMLKHRILVQNRKAATENAFGLDGAGVEWEDTVWLWAAVDWQKGMAGMRDGAFDAYGVIMFRTRYTTQINMRSRIVYEGQTYQILPEYFHVDKQANTIQFHAQVIVE